MLMHVAALGCSQPGVVNPTETLTEDRRPPAGMNRNKRPEMEIPDPFVPHHDSSDINIPGSDQFPLHDGSPSFGTLEFSSITEPSFCNWLLPDQPVFAVNNLIPNDFQGNQIAVDNLIPSDSKGKQISVNNLIPNDCHGNPSIAVNNLIPNGSQGNQLAFDMIKEYSGNVVDNYEGLSGVIAESFGLENANVCLNTLPESSGLGSPAQLPECPDLPSSYTLLREISHTNGKEVRNLEIYGLVGMISHAIVYKAYPDVSENVDYQVFNFSGESLSNVKIFLVRYWEECKQEGFWMTQDPFFEFYQVLCMGLNHENDNLASSDALQPFMVSSEFGSGNGQIPMKQHETDRTGRSKINLSKQRERTGKLKLKDFSKYFDLRITDVAKKFNVCPSVIKKKCREGGLKKWPYRKIKGIKRKINQKKEILTACTDEERPRTLLEIQKLEQQLQDIFIKLGELQM